MQMQLKAGVGGWDGVGLRPDSRSGASSGSRRSSNSRASPSSSLPRASSIAPPLGAVRTLQLLQRALRSGAADELAPRLARAGRRVNNARTLPLSKRQKTEATEAEADECDRAGGCLEDWREDKGFNWDNPSPVRKQLMEDDPGLNQSLISSATTISQIFNQDMWEKHRCPERYFNNLHNILESTVLRRILSPLLSLVALATAISMYNAWAPGGWIRLATSLVPHTLLGAALSLLLVFRTNGCFNRFSEGRLLWGQLVRASRDWSRLAANYFPEALKKRAARYVQVYAFVLKAHLRKGLTRKDPKDPTSFRDDPTSFVHELLPPSEAELVLQQTNRPYFVLLRMTQLAKEADASLPLHIRAGVESVLKDLLQVAGGCDRILGTPIPLSYTRHTSRSLILWLATLPFGLWPTTGWLTAPTLLIIAFIFLGIDEIGVEIEEPFAILPLLPLCKTITNDVRMAMTMPPPYSGCQWNGSGAAGSTTVPQCSAAAIEGGGAWS